MFQNKSVDIYFQFIHLFIGVVPQAVLRRLGESHCQFLANLAFCLLIMSIFLQISRNEQRFEKQKYFTEIMYNMCHSSWCQWKESAGRCKHGDKQVWLDELWRSIMFIQF